MESRLNLTRYNARSAPVSARPTAGGVVGATTQKRPRCLKLASWNVRTLLQPGCYAKLGLSLKRYQVDFACLSELRLPDSGTTVIETPSPVNNDRCESHPEYVLWHTDRHPAGQQGVGFAVRHRLKDSVLEWDPVSPRLAYLRVAAKPVNLSLVSVYAPTNGSSLADIDAFYHDLQQLLNRIPRKDMLLIAGDFNAQMGEPCASERPYVGRFTTGPRCSNGDRLINLCMQEDLSLSNTGLRRNPRGVFTWKSNDRSHTKNQIDYVAIRRTWRSAIRNVSVRWNDLALDSDHGLLVADVKAKLMVKKRQPAQHRFDMSMLSNPRVKELFQNKLTTSIESFDQRQPDLEATWQVTRQACADAASEYLVGEKRPKNHWITPATLDQIKLRDAAKRAGDSVLTRNLNRAIKRCTRRDKDAYWTNKALELESAAARGNSRLLFRSLKQAAGKFSKISEVIKNKNGDVITVLGERVSRWREHFNELLNRPPPGLPMPPLVPSVTDGQDPVSIAPPSLEEILSAIRSLKNNKAAGPDGIHAEMLKHGGSTLQQHLLKLFQTVWHEERVPSDWGLAAIVPVFKKGDSSNVKNYRGISLLALALKILEIIVLRRILPLLESTARENQAGFRPGRSCNDQIFALRQVLELRHEYRRPTIVCFVDFSAAFDSVTRNAIMDILLSKNVPSKVVNVIRAMYVSTKSMVRVYGQLTEPFEIATGVRQGSCLSPTLFNLLVDWVLFQSLDDVPDVGVPVSGSLLTDLAYADDIALFAETESDLQRFTDALAENAAKVGLTISAEKTKLIHANTPTAPVVLLYGQPLEVVQSFRYLGSEVTPNGDVSYEMRSRGGKAVGAFNLLNNCLWRRNDISIKTKARVYQASVRPVLLYGCETWPVKQIDLQKAEVLERRCWRKAMGLRLQDRVRNEDLRTRFANIPPLDGVMRRSRLRWLGHTLRMNTERLPKRTLQAGPEPGWKRPRGGVRQTWRRLVTKDLEPFLRHPQMGHRSWSVEKCLQLAEENAADRRRWAGLTRDAMANP